MQIASTGGRRLTQAALEGRSFGLDEGRVVSRKDLASAAREAEKALSLRPTLRLVLHELVSVWGEKELGGRLLVWPSNDYLMGRTGLSERAIRVAVRHLTELRLITPKDSANGKRFGIRNAAGEIVDAYGFDLTPLYARRGELAYAVVQQKAHREAQRRVFDDLTICRRAIEEALSAHASAFGDPSSEHVAQLEDLVARTPRRGADLDLRALQSAYQDLRRNVEHAFYEAGKAGLSCRHIETDNELPTESCPTALRKDAETVRFIEQTPEHISLGLILEACPALTDYGRPIRDVTDLVNAARYLRGSLGAHESVWREAVDRIGAVKAATAVAYVLQIYTDDVSSGTNRIRNAGGYLRSLVRLIDERKFTLETELMTLRRRHMG